MDTALLRMEFPGLVPPQDVLQTGGVHVWRIHAQDGNVLPGDFDHGSLSPEMRFSVE
jgi:hypothetical protein